MRIPNRPGNYEVLGLRIIVTLDEILIDEKYLMQIQQPISMQYLSAPGDEFERLPHRQQKAQSPQKDPKKPNKKFWDAMNEGIQGINDSLMGKGKDD
jgi:hypothetical protein